MSTSDEKTFAQPGVGPLQVAPPVESEVDTEFDIISVPPKRQAGQKRNTLWRCCRKKDGGTCSELARSRIRRYFPGGSLWKSLPVCFFHRRKNGRVSGSVECVCVCVLRVAVWTRSKAPQNALQRRDQCTTRNVQRPGFKTPRFGHVLLGKPSYFWLGRSTDGLCRVQADMSIDG